jgi:hypothetical protein
MHMKRWLPMGEVRPELLDTVLDQGVGEKIWHSADPKPAGHCYYAVDTMFKGTVSLD